MEANGVSSKMHKRTDWDSISETIYSNLVNETDTKDSVIEVAL